MYKGATCCNCFWCLVILVIDALLAAGLGMMVAAGSHQMLVAVNWPLCPDTTVDAAVLICGDDYEDAYEDLLAYSGNKISAYYAIHQHNWNQYLDIWAELEVEVDDSDLYARRLSELAARIQGEWREERVDGCEDPIYCGGEFGTQKCELNPNLNPLIETSGDTLTIGFNAEGLFPAV